MKQKIAILGSTGSIGKTLLDIINNDQKNFKIILLTTDKNYKLLFKQAKKFKVKNLIIRDEKKYQIAIQKKTNLNIYNDFENFDKIFKNKVDYTMSSISGIEGLYPTINIIKHTKKIAIANKESIICGWNLLNKELKKNKTDFVPVDSEHFSLWYALKYLNINQVERIFITASGGPFQNLPLNKFKNITISQALKHPNWKMGKKISIDSATMMNKVFEIIEAQKIFNIPYKKINILVHPKSYIHAIVKFKSGMIKIIAHDTNMTIPIHNSIYFKNSEFLKTKKVDLEILNNLQFKNVDYDKFPITKVISKLSDKDSLFETVLVSANDELVNLFLKKKIKFTDIAKKLKKFLSLKDYIRYKYLKPNSVSSILKLNKYVRFKIKNLSI